MTEPPASPTVGSTHRRRPVEVVGSMALGLGLVLVLLEAFLRILGATHPVAAPEDVAEKARSTQDRTTILCVGDSYTWGVGASPGADFPHQLETLLLQAEVPVQVFNAGIPGANTGFILAALPRYLAMARPDVVIVLAGGANLHNRFGYAAWRDTSESRLGALEALVFRVRVLRFARYAVTRLESGYDPTMSDSDGWTDLPVETASPSMYIRWRRGKGRPVGPDFVRGAALLEVGDVEGARVVFEEGRQRIPGDAAYLWGLGACARKLRDFDKADRLLADAVALDPSDPVSWFTRGEVYQDRMQGGAPEGETAYRDGIRADPAFAPNYCALGRVEIMVRRDFQRAMDWMEKGARADPEDHLCYSMMVASAQTPDQKKRAREVLTLMAARSQAARDHLARLDVDDRDTDLTGWIRHDLMEIIRLSRDAGASLVLQTYPQRHQANAVIRDVAAAESLPVLDMESRVSEWMTTGVRIATLTRPDGHYSDEGNRRVAVELAGMLGVRPQEGVSTTTTAGDTR